MPAYYANKDANNRPQESRPGDIVVLVENPNQQYKVAWLSAAGGAFLLEHPIDHLVDFLHKPIEALILISREPHLAGGKRKSRKVLKSRKVRKSHRSTLRKRN